jgi:hypothetical protein
MTGFGATLRAEWTKFRTVRGWVIAMLLGGAAIVGLGLLPGAQGSCGRNGPASACVLPVGPEGQEVTDSFTFVHRRLAGDGSVTVRVTSLAGRLALPPGEERPDPGPVPWAKAGLIIKDGTAPGSAYAAVMVTGNHGVRMQYNYTHDIAGAPGKVGPSSPRWLRLTRTGDTITGEESPDGTQWTAVGSARLDGLPPTVEIGLFTTSPQYAEVTSEALGVAGAMGGPSQATATFDQLTRQGTWQGSWPDQAWTGERIGGSGNEYELQRGGYEQADGGFTLSGSGDIAPAVAGPAGIGLTITQTLVGTFAGLIIMVVLGAVFVTAEYRRGLIRTTVAASPRRGRVLAAKAIVVVAVTFVTGLAAAATVVAVGQRVLRASGVYVHTATTATQVRVVVGTAAMLAVAAVLAVALGWMLRRSAAAVTVGVVVIVLPYLLAMTVLPAGAAQWLLRVTPAAAFAVQQSSPQYDQVDNIYTPVAGYFPLAPWAGLAVLCGWAALALGLAGYRFGRSDA